MIIYECFFQNEQKSNVIITMNGYPFYLLKPKANYILKMDSLDSEYARWSEVIFKEKDGEPVIEKIERPEWIQHQRAKEKAGKFFIEFVNDSLRSQGLFLGSIEKTIIIPAGFSKTVEINPRHEPLWRFRKISWKKMVREKLVGDFVQKESYFGREDELRSEDEIKRGEEWIMQPKMEKLEKDRLNLQTRLKE